MLDYQKLYTALFISISDLVDAWPDLGPEGERLKTSVIDLLQDAENRYIDQQ